MANESIKINEYCYSLVLKKFTEGVNLEQAGCVARWSPNNLRRIIISPDGVLLQYFTTSGAHTNKLLQPVVFKDRNKCSQCFIDGKYKPIVSMLVGKRICSSLEEIIYLTKSSSGLQLPETELRLQELVERSKVQSSEKELLDNIGDRFVRLRALIFMDLSMQELTSDKEFSKNVKNPLFLFADDDYFKGKVIKVYDIHKNDWWNHTRLRPQYYGLDAEGGSLSTYFDRVKNIKQTEEHDNKLKSIKEKGVSEKIDKFRPALNEVESKCKLIYNYFKTIAGLSEISLAFPAEVSKDGWQTIRPDFKGVEELRYIKTGAESGSKIFYKGLRGFGVDVEYESQTSITMENLNNDIRIVKSINLSIDEYCINLFKACYSKLVNYNNLICEDIVKENSDIRTLVSCIPKIQNLNMQEKDEEISKVADSIDKTGLTIKIKYIESILDFALYIADFFERKGEHE